MKILFVYPRFARHAETNPELLGSVPMNEYLGSPSLGIAAIAAITPEDVEIEYRDDRLEAADVETDADLVALSFFTPAASRALELADYFRSSGKTVVAGGIFPTMMPDVVQPHVDAVVVGEGEGSWQRLLSDFRQGGLEPRYRAVESVDVTQLPKPKLSLYLKSESDRFEPDDYPVQISRGCALSCQSCALPVSMTRKLRVFNLEQVISQIDQLASAGKRACLTEDTSWFPGGRGRRRLVELFEHLIDRGGDAVISYIGISMPMILNVPTALFERAKLAGVNMFYLVGGFDPITMNAFTGRDPKAHQRASDAIQKSHDLGIVPYTSFLIGNDQDDEGTADRMLQFCLKTKIRKAEFAIFTPYPGTPSWHRLLAEGRILTTDWRRYNDADVVFAPKNMSPERLKADYLKLWSEFYRGRSDVSEMSVAERTIQF